MRRSFIALISALLLLGAPLGLPADAAAPPTTPLITIGTITSSSITATWLATAGLDLVTYEATISPAEGTGSVAAGSIATGTTFEGLSPGVEYTITVVASDAAGPASNTAQAITLLAPPGSPVINTVAVAETLISVSWTADAGGGTNTYEATIAPDDGGGAGFVGPGSAALATVFTGLTPNTSYTITVTADNGSGLAASSMLVISTSEPAATVPDAPAQPTATQPASDRIAIAWDPPADNGAAIVDYEVFLSNGLSQVVVGPSAEFTVQRPSSGLTATVVARNIVGPSAASPASSPAIDAPVVEPSIVSFSAAVVAGSKTSILVSWSPPADVGDDVDGLAGYRITVFGAPGLPFDEPLADVPGNEFTINGLTPGETYEIRVRARNSAGLGAFDQAADIPITLPDLDPPGAPANVSADGDLTDPNDVTVSWQAPTSGDPAVVYRVSFNNGGPTKTVSSEILSTRFDDVPRGNYTVTVTAIGAEADGGSGTATVSVPGLPGAPTNVAASLLGIDGLTVSWSPPGDNGGQALTGYTVSVSPSIGQDIPDPEAGVTSLELGGLIPGTVYVVTVRAKNGLGAGPGEAASGVLIPTTPGAATNVSSVQAPLFTASATITWELPADDGGSPLTQILVTVDGVTQTLGADATSAGFANLSVGLHTATVQTLTLAGDGPVATSPPFEVRAFAPFATEEEFITQLYADFLRRNPDPGGLAFWLAETRDDGSNIESIVTAFMGSPEFSPRRAVARLYFVYFNRQPDGGGFDYWTRLIASGQGRLNDASNVFASSEEFTRQYGSLNNAEFVVLVYSNVLNRRPDLPGFQFWLAQLNAGRLSRGQLMTQFSEAPEFVLLSRPAVDVTVTYYGMLQRRPDDAGFLFWKNQVNTDANSLNTLIRAFFESDEYAIRVDR